MLIYTDKLVELWMFCLLAISNLELPNRDLYKKRMHAKP
jgi:hypothetical protein